MDKCNCFIRKSTKELTEKLYKLGERTEDKFWHSSNALLIADDEKFYCLDDKNNNAESLFVRGFIDCKENEELFLALCRIGTKEVWATDGINMILSIKDKIKSPYHAANKMEIIKYFNKHDNKEI